MEVFMKRISKTIRPTALLTALILLLSSCSQTDSSYRSADSSVLPESLRDLSFEEHLDISIGYWNIDSMMKATEADGMTNYIEELFNITIHPVSVTWATYKERYQILSATDSLPDVFATVTISSNDNNDSSTFVNMIETGSVRALPSDMTAFPNIRKLLDSVSYTQYADGNYYAIPRLSFTEPSLGSTDAAMLVRRDWMDNLGIDDPGSFQEFAAMTAAFANDDPDGNGLDDTIGYNVNNLSALGKWVILGIYPEGNVYGWITEDGRYVPSWTTEEFKDVITAYRHLYETGGLDPAFYSKTPNIVIDDFASGRLGALEYKSSPNSLMEIKEKWDTQNDKPFEECVDVLPVFAASDGVRYSNSSSIFWSESFISSAADDAKAERILALFEFLLSEEGIRLGKYGIRGVDYMAYEDGGFECLLETGDESLSTVLARKYPSISLFYGIASWGGGWEDFELNEMNYLRFGEICVQLGRKSARWNLENTTQLTRPYAFLMAPKESTEIFSTTNAMDAMIKCIIGTQDPVTMWETYLAEMYDAGLEAYIQRQNDYYH